MSAELDRNISCGPGCGPMTISCGLVSTIVGYPDLVDFYYAGIRVDVKLLLLTILSHERLRVEYQKRIAILADGASILAQLVHILIPTRNTTAVDFSTEHILGVLFGLVVGKEEVFIMLYPGVNSGTIDASLLCRK